MKTRAINQQYREAINGLVKKLCQMWTFIFHLTSLNNCRGRRHQLNTFIQNIKTPRPGNNLPLLTLLTMDKNIKTISVFIPRVSHLTFIVRNIKNNKEISSNLMIKTKLKNIQETFTK